MKRRLAVRACVPALVLGLLGAFGVGSAAQATTVPLPLGVVSGTVSTSTTCFPSQGHCNLDTYFDNVKATGRLTVGGTGLQVQVSASRMQYESVQWFCPDRCGPTPPALLAPVDVAGSTAAGSHFEATCSTGDMRGADVEVVGAVVTMVSALCQGGTATVQGPFAFRFDVPALPLLGFVSLNGSFVASLVEAR